jgi:hypothetical protein
VEPPTEKARLHVSVIRVLMVLQAVVVILNFVAAAFFLRAAIFGIFLFFVLYIAQHLINYQSIMVQIFFSIYFAIDFLVFFLLPLQKGTDLSTLPNMDKFAYAVSVVSFVYYCFCLVFCFYPYREFKAIAYN